MSKNFLTTLLLLAGMAAVLEGRIFTNTAGKTLEAEIVRATSKTVTLRLQNKRTTTIKLDTLSAADQEHVAAWLADRVPRLRFDPNVIRSNKAERDSDFFSSSYNHQGFEMTVNVTNDENAKGLEESTMKFILVGRSQTDRDKYKILSVQEENFSVLPAGRTAVLFRKVINKYYDSGYSKSGFKCIGYVLYATRKKDKREVWSHASTQQLKEVIPSLVTLKMGTITDKFFQAPLGGKKDDGGSGPIIVE